MVKAKIILPAMLLLSALSGLSFQQKEVKTYLEFGDAQEEIFGEAQGIEIAHKGLKGKVTGALPAPKVGFQFKTHDDYVDIRFVAAIKITDLSNVTATWTRTNVDSNLVVGKEYTKESTKAYTALNIDGKDVSATSLEGDYNYFVAYVVRNIPQATASGNYLDVKFSLQEGEDSVNSDIFSVKCDGSTGFSRTAGTNTFFAYYNYPSANDDGTFNTIKTRVAEGDKVVEASPFGGNEEDIVISNAGQSEQNNGTYKFDNWFTALDSNKYATLIGNNVAVVENANYYARYTCENTLYYKNGSHRVYTRESDQVNVINEDYALYGTRILGYSSFDDDNPEYAFLNLVYTSIDLTSSSGVYKLVRNEDSWTILRKITYQIQPADWAGRYMYLWCSGSPSLLPQYSAGRQGWHSYVFIDSSYTKVTVTNYSSSTGIEGQTSWKADDCWKAGDLEISSYSETNQFLSFNHAKDMLLFTGVWGS